MVSVLSEAIMLLSVYPTCQFRQHRILAKLYRATNSRRSYAKAIKRYALSDKTIKRRQAGEASAEQAVRSNLEDWHRDKTMKVSAAEAQSFIQDIQQWNQEAISREHPLDEVSFKNACQKYSISENDALKVGAALRNSNDRSNVLIARSIFNTLALSGNSDAIDYVVGTRIQLNSRFPERATFTDSPMFRRNRKAMQRSLYKTESTATLQLELWIRMIEDPVTALQLLEEFVDRISVDDLDFGLYPWRELDGIFQRQFERAIQERRPSLAKQILEKLIRTSDVGIANDDAYSYYHKAGYMQKRYVVEEKLKIAQGERQAGEVGICRDWLYYMTKAGCTGYVPAAEALGHFYATHLDKWIDEKAGGHEGTLSNRIWRAFGLSWTPLDAIESIGTQSAIFSGADQRLALAVYWHEIAAGFGFAPAYLSLARLQLTKTFEGPDFKTELKNTEYDKEKGIHALAKVWQALRAYDVYKFLDASKQGKVPSTDDAVRRAFNEKMEGLSFASDPKHNEILKQGIWSFAVATDVFQSWISDEKKVTKLAEDIEKLADTSRCDIVLGDMLIYSHKKLS